MKNTILVTESQYNFLIESVHSDAIRYVYENTPVNKLVSLDEYVDYVNSFYENYFMTRHSSPSDDILNYKIKLPSERGVDYNSVDAFFVSPDLNPMSDTAYRKQGNIKNFYVMIPKDYNFLYTDYNFSNVPNFYDDLMRRKESGESITSLKVFKYNGDKIRELGYDVVVPNEGKDYEWIVVNPSSLIVLGSKYDIKNLQQFL